MGLLINIACMAKILSPEDRTIVLKKFMLHDPIDDMDFSRFIGVISKEAMLVYNPIYTPEERLPLLETLEIEKEEDLTVVKMWKDMNEPNARDHFCQNEFHMIHIISQLALKIAFVFDEKKDPLKTLDESVIFCNDFGYKNTAMTLHCARKIYPQEEDGDGSCLKLKTFYNYLYLSLIGV